MSIEHVTAHPPSPLLIITVAIDSTTRHCSIERG
jgi:hypothetical protein